MTAKDPLFDYDPGYYEVIKDVWLPGKLTGPKPFGTWTRKAVDAAVNMDLDDSDVLLASYPKTGIILSVFLSVSTTFVRTVVFTFSSPETAERDNGLDLW